MLTKVIIMYDNNDNEESGISYDENNDVDDDARNDNNFENDDSRRLISNSKRKLNTSEFKHSIALLL